MARRSQLRSREMVQQSKYLPCTLGDLSLSSRMYIKSQVGGEHLHFLHQGGREKRIVRLAGRPV